ncbi:hypothetical protein RF11_00869 [Thelohanellus kitauei]|uniref:Uncharacterized protein n=1 Tax=Thelohanellus kitauei TaxID=669202 RepID=A0A0C2MTW0_THEKT|nr:hypothetical protein RF11_00869 [Thelohanellus kitauei]
MVLELSQHSSPKTWYLNPQVSQRQGNNHYELNITVNGQDKIILEDGTSLKKVRNIVLTEKKKVKKEKVEIFGSLENKEMNKECMEIKILTIQNQMKYLWTEIFRQLCDVESRGVGTV